MKFIEDIGKLLGDNIVRQALAEVANIINDPFEQLTELGLVTDLSIYPRENLRAMSSYYLTHLLVHRLPEPPVIVGEELTTPFVDSFRTLNDDAESDFDDFAELFLSQLATLPVAERRSQPLQIGTGPFVAVRNDERAYAIEPLKIFESESGFSIWLIGVLPAADQSGLAHGDLQHTACIQLEANCSPPALDAAIAELQDVFSTLIRSGVVLSQLRAMQFFSSKANAEVSLGSASDADDQEDEDEEVWDDPRDYRRSVIKEEYMIAEGFFIGNGKLGPWFSFIPDCLQCTTLTRQKRIPFLVVSRPQYGS